MWRYWSKATALKDTITMPQAGLAQRVVYFPGPRYNSIAARKGTSPEALLGGSGVSTERPGPREPAKLSQSGTVARGKGTVSRNRSSMSYP